MPLLTTTDLNDLHRLLKTSAKVTRFRAKSSEFKAISEKLKDALHKAPRSQFALAAPLIGIRERIVAVRALGDTETETQILVNPVFTKAPQATTRAVWEDCLCCPLHVINVRRWNSGSVSFKTESFEKKVLENLEFWQSAALQHQIEHLHGALAFDLDCVDPIRDVVLREHFNKRKAEFLCMAEYFNHHV